MRAQPTLHKVVNGIRTIPDLKIVKLGFQRKKHLRFIYKNIATIDLPNGLKNNRQMSHSTIPSGKHLPF